MSRTSATLVHLGALFAALLAAGCSTSGVAQIDRYERPPGWEDDNGWDEWGMIHYGQRTFDDGGLSEGDDHFAVGLELAGQPRGAWLALELGLWVSSSEADWTHWGPAFGGLDEEDFTTGESGSRSFELSLGARKEVRPFDGPFVLVGGAGAAMVQLDEARLDAAFVDDRDSDIGVYVHGGAFLALGGTGRIGIDLRRVEGTEHELLGRTTSGDYMQWSLVLSFYF